MAITRAYVFSPKRYELSQRNLTLIFFQIFTYHIKNIFIMDVLFYNGLVLSRTYQYIVCYIYYTYLTAVLIDLPFKEGSLGMILNILFFQMRIIYYVDTLFSSIDCQANYFF